MNVATAAVREKRRAKAQEQADRVLIEVLDDYFVSHGIDMSRAISPISTSWEEGRTNSPKWMNGHCVKGALVVDA